MDSLTTANNTGEKRWGGLYPADPKGRRLAPRDSVCKAAQTPHAGARRRTTAELRAVADKREQDGGVGKLVFLLSYSLPNQYQKQQKRRRQEDTKKHSQKQTNACSGGGGELERGAISPSYLSLPALALNECSSTLGHITFVLYESL